MGDTSFRLVNGFWTGAEKILDIPDLNVIQAAKCDVLIRCFQNVGKVFPEKDILDWLPKKFGFCIGMEFLDLLKELEGNIRVISTRRAELQLVFLHC